MQLTDNQPWHPVTLRAVILGLVCVIFLCLITPYNDYAIYGTFVAGNHFPIGSFFLYIIIMFIGFITLARWKPKWGLRPSEMITVWCMMIVASGIPSSGFIRYHLFMLVAPYYYATPENEWEDLFFRYLPDSMMVKDPKAVKYFYEKLPAGAGVPWGEWLRPMLVWSAYVLMTYFVLVCLSVILRRQWVDHERFTFPLVRLPVEMVENTEPKNRVNNFMKNRMLWIGAGIAVVLHLINGLHAHIPSVPRIPLYFSMDPYLNDRPWTAMRSLIMMIYPSIIGFSYLLSLDVSFSFWIFYIIYKIQSVVAYASGFPASGWTLANRQEMGGYIALVIFVLWLSRRHLKDIFMVTIGLRKVDDSNEPLPYRWALLGFVFGTVIIAGMAWMAGMSFGLAIGVMIFFYVMAIVLTWMVADGGFLFLLAIFRPSDYLMISMGSSSFDAASHTILTFEKTLMFDLREFMMPHIMNSFKATDFVRLKRRQLLGVLGIVMVVAIATSYYSGLMTWYHVGGLKMGYWYDPEPFNRLTSFLNYPRDTNWMELSFIITGFVVMSFLIFMRYTFFWWRVHPLGYAMTTSWAPYTIWFSIFLGWLSKFVILKFGGLKLYRQMRPFFLGIVMGESFIGGLWIIIGLFTKVSYRILPG
ncbi:hypothetical protein GF312_17815 [Candidatus Poribacteria bacterium]|nr:hypothetical protein [Candidatus Poribacteria bacterium]